MAKYIDWYLVEVERLIGQSIPREKLHETLREVESHLCAAKDAALTTGLEDRNAELAAIESFGSPSTFTTQFLEPKRAMWQRVAKGLAVICGAGWALVVPWGFYTHESIGTWILLALLALFGIGSIKSEPIKLVLLGPIMLVAGIVQLALFSALFVPLNSGGSHVAFIERELAVPGTQVSFLRSAIYFLPQAAQATIYAAMVLLAVNWIAAWLGHLPRRLARSRALV